jgi:NAD(P)-dependent dehydrogenase (short-subunit alcohol dehydrogenase family)
MTELLKKDAVAIVTGGAGGIGLGIVEALAESGINVACWDRAGADFDAPLRVCRAAGVAGLAVEMDVRDRQSCLDSAARSGDLGVVKYGVNCAGIDRLQPTIGMPDEVWNEVLDINLSGILYSCMAEYEAMDHRGSIVNIASMSGSVYNRDAQPHIGYSASKAGVVHLSRCLAVEWAKEGIRVNSVSPGYTRTRMTDMNPPELNERLASNVPMGRMAEVSEIAHPVLFLLSDGAAYISGHDLLVDGGLTAW